MRRFRPTKLFLALSLLATPALVRAQIPSALPAAATSTPPRRVTSITLAQSIAALNGPWKFHIGDNPAWADPNFDDATWETVDLAPKAGAIDPVVGFSSYVPGWTTKGHPGYWGYAWYRIRVRVTAQPGEKLALAGPADVDDAYQVFADGRLLGSFGKFPAPGSGAAQAPVAYNSQPRMFPLAPPRTNAATGTQVLAFRVWMIPNTLTFEPDAGGMHSAPLLGTEDVVEARYQLAWQETLRAYASSAVLAPLFLLLAILAASLVLFDRSDAVYGWLAAAFLLTAFRAVTLCLAAWTQLIGSVSGEVLLEVVFRPLILGAWVMVWWVWFRLRRPAWMPRAIAGLTALYMLSQALGNDLFFAVVSHPVSAVFHEVSLAVRLLFLALLVFIVLRGIRQEGREGWLALPAVVLVGIAQFEFDLGLLHIRAVWFPFGLQVSLASVAYLLLAVVIFGLLLRRLLLSVRRQREMALDVKQAQEVQQVLIPQELPQVPGLAIESEYRPAREVGGDFFQIVPHLNDGSVLIVLGDVTGHGLQAAMLVALLVGAIRERAEASLDPLRMLQSLNRRLVGRGQANATCLALRLAPDGACTLANAGHLPPYLNGKEIRMEGALPLGAMEGAEFSVMQFQLQPGDRLTLITDGIAEAQNEKKELFGFDRTLELLRQQESAVAIAAAAQAFGQQDDITVLSVMRLGSADPATMATPELATT